MMRFRCCHYLLAAFLLALPLQPGFAKQPNIVIILADDMGYDAISVNNPAIGALKTPYIDRLASQGMNFHDAHSASAVCSPTRYGLLTGRYAWRTELKKEVLWDYGRPLIEPDRLTLPGLLREQGYTTGMIGKWHLGHDWPDADGGLATAEMLGAKLPAGAAPDSTSILPLLTGKAARLPVRPPVVHHDYKGNFAIRHGKWKLVGTKLFDLDADPKEQTDLAAAHPEVAQRLAAALEACQTNEGG